MSYLKINSSKERDQIVEKYKKILMNPITSASVRTVQDPSVMLGTNSSISVMLGTNSSVNASAIFGTNPSSRSCARSSKDLSVNVKRDTLFGVQYKGDGLYIGKSPITITEGNSIDKTKVLTIGDINYNLTTGLLESITKFNPDIHSVIFLYVLMKVFTKSKLVTFTASSDMNDVAREFVDSLEKENRNIYEKIKFPKKMIFNKKDEDDFNSAKTCHICKKDLDKDRDRDHCHITGKYRGAAHKHRNKK